MFNEAGKLAKETISGTPLACPRGSAVKAPTRSAWSSSGTSKSSGYVPPHLRAPNDPPARHAASVSVNARPHPRATTTGNAGSAPVYARNIGATAQQPAQHRNPSTDAACCGSAHPRNSGAAPPKAVQPCVSSVQPVAAWGSIASTRPMARNTSYPVNNNGSGSVSHASDRSSHFPGRGPPIQSIRTSRSNSATHGTSRNSRSNSREPQRSTMTNSRISASSRPQASYPNPRATSRSSSGSSTTAYSRSVVVSFDSNKILTDFINSRLQEAGVSAPPKIEIKNNHAYIKFASVEDVDQVKQQMSSGTPLRISTIEAFRQSKV